MGELLKAIYEAYAKPEKEVYGGGFSCKKRQKRLSGVSLSQSERFRSFR